MGGARLEKLSKKKSSSGINVLAGQIDTLNDTTNYTAILSDITNMRNGDCIASSALDILKLPLKRANIQIIGADTKIGKQAKDYIQYIFDNLQKDKYREGGLRQTIEHMLLCLDYGFAIFEPIWNIQQYGNYMTKRLVYLSPISPDTIYQWHYDNDIEFVGITQQKYNLNGGWETVYIPASELFIIVFGEEFFDVRGRAILRKARTVFKYKERVMNSLARAIARGAGIVKVKLSSLADEDLQNKAETIGRTLGNADNAYVITQDNILDVDLIELKNQQQAMELLSYFDRQMLFNTLTQFMTAGIGENGSRAATGELKTPYELQIQNIADLLENSLNELIIRIVRESFLYGALTNNDYPKVKLSLAVNTALDEISSALTKLIQVNAIKISEEDEKYLRSIFSLPQKKIIDELENKPKGQIELELHTPPKHFEFEKIDNLYTMYQERTDKVIENIYKDMLMTITEYISKGKEVRRDKEKIDEYVKMLTSIWNELVFIGEADMKKELVAIGYQFTAKEQKERTKKKIVRQVKTLFYDTEQVAENIVEQATKKQLENGLKEFLFLKLGDGMKTIRRSLSATILDGYTEGRNNIIQQAGDDIEYQYCAILDKDVCEVCAPLDGLIATKTEWEEQGLRIAENGRINPECLGAENCRCALIPVNRR